MEWLIFAAAFVWSYTWPIVLIFVVGLVYSFLTGLITTSSEKDS